MSGDPSDEACAAALAALPGAGPVGLARLLAEAGGPAAAWDGVRAGRFTRPGGARHGSGPPWVEAARRYEAAAQWSGPAGRGVGVTWLGAASYPTVLAGDPEPPAVLFWRGDLGALSRRRVAIVGTRRCTPDGALTAAEIGCDLAAAGVCVVSGLALGIDAAAHRGALRTMGSGVTAGVAASGVDVVYPRSHAGLWEDVVAAGVVVSETPPGRPAQAWRFPMRNRVIAGLAEVVVVVESHEHGGSMLTVDAAIDRGVEVCAVPGPVRSPASAGTNQLLRDGPAAVRSATDILDHLGDFRSPSAPAGRPPARSPGRPPSAAATRVLAAVGYRPTSLGTIVDATRLAVGDVAGALDELAAAGAVVEQRGWWQRR